MSPEEITAIENGLFPLARSIVREEPRFPWHLDRDKVATATLAASSQAMAIDFFQTIKRLPSRDAIVEHWLTHLGIKFTGPWDIELEHLLAKEVLHEPRPTQIDALATSPSGVIAFECKYTEPDGGSCSQTIPIASGAHAGMIQCNGRYEEQTNEVNGKTARCALTSKGVRYWELVPRVFNCLADRDHAPCPFQGGWYQWMRNLLAASELGAMRGVKGAVVVLFADGDFPMAQKVKSKEWEHLLEAVAGREVPLCAVSYQELLRLAQEVAVKRDRATLVELESWMTGLMRLVKARPGATRAEFLERQLRR